MSEPSPFSTPANFYFNMMQSFLVGIANITLINVRVVTKTEILV